MWSERQREIVRAVVPAVSANCNTTGYEIMVSGRLCSSKRTFCHKSGTDLSMNICSAGQMSINIRFSIVKFWLSHVKRCLWAILLRTANSRLRSLCNINVHSQHQLVLDWGISWTLLKIVHVRAYISTYPSLRKYSVGRVLLDIVFSVIKY